ncbi:MAG: hypothetical protein GY711_27120 [bacterium]|nr:hypothetical protein [bacterium]
MNPAQAAATIAALLLSAASALAQCDQGPLSSADTVAGDRFGRAVAVHGARAVVGAHWESELAQRAGAAYVFDRSASGWTETAKLLPSVFDDDGFFGAAVAVLGDRVLVGAPQESLSSTLSGVAYLFERSATGWSEVARLTSGPENGFGAAVALTPGRAFIGSPWSFPHKVSIFEPVGGVWTEVAAVREEQALDLFGAALDAEGDRLAVGASDGSRVRVYERQGTDWVETALLTRSGGFGAELDLEGTRLLVGAPFDDDVAFNTGAAYVFELTGGVWTETAKIVPSDGGERDGFGVAVALEGDALYIGSRRHDAGAVETGAVYSFERDATGWSEVEKLLGDGSARAHFGNSLALDRGRLVVGAERHDALGTDAGAALVLERFRMLGTSFCPATPHSGGVPAVLTANGCPDVAANLLEFSCAPVPPQRFGYFLMSQGQIVHPVSDSSGVICITPHILRFDQDIVSSGAVGELRLSVDFTRRPASMIWPGETWNFQSWFRDADPAPTSNFSTALAITFLTDVPVVQFPLRVNSIVEQAVVAEVSVTLSQPTVGPVEIPFTIDVNGTATEGLDYRVATPSPLVLATGETRGVLRFTIAEDAEIEDDETVLIVLETPVGASLGSNTSAWLTIVDDD